MEDPVRKGNEVEAVGSRDARRMTVSKDLLSPHLETVLAQGCLCCQGLQLASRERCALCRIPSLPSENGFLKPHYKMNSKCVLVSVI